MVNRRGIRLTSIITIIIGFSLLSCCRNNDKSMMLYKPKINDDNTYVFDESKAVILDENDYINTPIIDQTNYVTFYKNIKEIREAYPNLNIINIDCPEGFIPNYIDEKNSNIYNSWIVHMFADFAIMTIWYIYI